MKKYIGLTLLISLLGFLVPHLSAEAKTITAGQAVSGTLGKDEQHTYQIEVTKPSRVELKGTAYSSNFELVLEDAKGETVHSLYYEFIAASATTPVSKKTTEYLEKGTYTVRAIHHTHLNERTKYQFTVSVKDSRVTEGLSNDSKQSATKIASTQKTVKGQISWNDSVDYYKVTLKEAGRLSLDMTAYMQFLDVTMFNQNHEKIKSIFSLYEGGEGNGVTENMSVYLEKGMYYIEVKKYHTFTGIYTFKTKFTAAKNNEKEPNNTRSKAQVIKPNVQKVTGLLSWSDNIDHYKVNVTKNGKLHVNVQLKNTIYLTLYNRKGQRVDERIAFGNTKAVFNVKKGTYYVKIWSVEKQAPGIYKLAMSVPEMLPKSPTAKATKTKVTGTTYKSSKVTVKIGSKKYTGKSNSKGTFSIKIPKQKAKTKVYVSVTTGAGTSSYTKIYVK